MGLRSRYQSQPEIDAARDRWIEICDQQLARVYGSDAASERWRCDPEVEGARPRYPCSDAVNRGVAAFDGALVVPMTMPQAFERLYFVARAAQAQARLTGQHLQLIPGAVIPKTVAQFSSGGAAGWRDRADLHLDASKRILDRSHSDYAI